MKLTPIPWRQLPISRGQLPQPLSHVRGVDVTAIEVHAPHEDGPVALQPGGELGYFQTRFNVYDRKGAPCPTQDCGHLVKRLVQSGRSTFYCPSCQR